MHNQDTVVPKYDINQELFLSFNMFSNKTLKHSKLLINY
jgi:hypothetical protein